jgi:hypothetical protein
MRGLDPRIHDDAQQAKVVRPVFSETWIAGLSPAMTDEGLGV